MVLSGVAEAGADKWHFKNGMRPKRRYLLARREMTSKLLAQTHRA
jgi:hypothetical protein